jgi:hypothetical protein
MPKVEGPLRELIMHAAYATGRLLFYRGFTCMTGVDKISDFGTLEELKATWESWYGKKFTKMLGEAIDPTEHVALEDTIDALVHDAEVKLRAMTQKLATALVVYCEPELIEPNTHDMLSMVQYFLSMAMSDTVNSTWVLSSTAREKAGIEDDPENMMRGIPLPLGCLPPMDADDPEPGIEEVKRDRVHSIAQYNGWQVEEDNERQLILYTGVKSAPPPPEE